MQAIEEAGQRWTLWGLFPKTLLKPWAQIEWRDGSKTWESYDLLVYDFCGILRLEILQHGTLEKLLNLVAWPARDRRVSGSRATPPWRSPVLPHAAIILKGPRCARPHPLHRLPVQTTSPRVTAPVACSWYKLGGYSPTLRSWCKSGGYSPSSLLLVLQMQQQQLSSS